MKFRFCGDQDCPDWFLTQMATLSRLSSVKAKLLAQHVAGHLSGHKMNSEKTDALLADSKLPEEEVRSLLASIQFVLSSASRFETSEEHLRAELQQIGLPREHATALAKVHHDATEAIRRNLVRQSLMVNRLEDVDWQSTGTGLIQLNLKIKPKSKCPDLETITLMVEPAKLQTLLYELEKCKQIMEENGL